MTETKDIDLKRIADGIELLSGEVARVTGELQNLRWDLLIMPKAHQDGESPKQIRELAAIRVLQDLGYKVQLGRLAEAEPRAEPDPEAVRIGGIVRESLRHR